MARWILAISLSVAAATVAWNLMSIVGLLDFPWPTGGNSWGQANWHSAPGGFGLFILFLGVIIFSIFHLGIPLLLTIGMEDKDRIKSGLLIAAVVTLVICAILFGKRLVEYPLYVIVRCSVTVLINAAQTAFCLKLRQSMEQSDGTT